ncbi:MAG TPA: biotin/lipoate A/B protein ligase family protein [Candidatus Dormibacteraeota bacterium]
MSERWRLLLDPAAQGAWNMAVDEVLLEGVVAGTTPPTLRFYQWQPACLSLGYFQSFEVVNLDGCRAFGVDIVRRPTGGRAILHDRELTYSVAMPVAMLEHDGGVLPSYYRLSLALQDGLRGLGVPAALAPVADAATTANHGPVCFDQPSAHEILLDGRKLVGSAQVRRGGGLLQHGSILIEPRIATLMACLQLPGRPSGSAGSTALGWEQIEKGVAGLAEADVSNPAQIAVALARAFAMRFGVTLFEAPLRPEEAAAAQVLARSKYQAAGWTQRRLPEMATNTTRTR